MMNLEKFLAENTRDGGFLQSKHWADFQKEIGAKVFEWEEKNARALLVEHNLPVVGKYWYCPRGPVFEANKEEGKTQNNDSKLRIFLNRMVKEAKDNGVGWIRIEPQSGKVLAEIKKELSAEAKIFRSKKNHQPAQTLMIDLEKSEEEILATMKPKTRYNIRLSQRKGVEVYETRDEKEVEKFCDLLYQTAKRDKINPHPRVHYRVMMEAIDEEVLKLYVAVQRGKILAGAMVSYYGKVATYLHGASSDQRRNLMAPYALHWCVIQEAKWKGMKSYDLGGTRIVESCKVHKVESRGEVESYKVCKVESRDTDANADTDVNTGGDKRSERKEYVNLPAKGSWEGITRFKIGFGPKMEPIQFPGCWDVVLDARKYSGYRILQTLSDLWRRIRN